MKRKLHLIFSLTLTILLPACSFGGTEPTPTPTSAQTTAVQSSPTATLEPTATTAPPTAILLAPDGANTAEAEAALNQVAAAAGLQVLRQNALDPAAAPAGLRLVLAVGPQNDPTSLAAALPQVQFVATGYTGLTPTANLTILSGSAGDANQAFMAGYIAAAQSDQWRTGIISTNDSAGQTYRQAFEHGVIYFCGSCAPLFPPYESYPIYVELPSGASQSELEAAVEVLYSRGVQVAHIIPSLQNSTIYQYMVQRDMVLVGTTAPPAGLEGYWVSSVLQEPTMSLADTLQRALNTGASGHVGSTIKIDFTGISTARIQHFEEIIQMLESGYIDPVGAVQ